MNNLHRELAPISAEAWTDLEAEAARTFKRHVAARRVVDVLGPSGPTLAAVGTGHTEQLDSADPDVRVLRRTVASVVELRVPFTVERSAVDDVERGAKDADWQPVKDAARKLAFTEDRAVVDGLAPAGITGIRAASDNPALHLPGDAREYPTVIAQALTTMRLAGVAGPLRLLLSADAYTEVAETTDHGYPVREHITRVLGADSEIVWAPAISGGLLLSARGGDFELHLGQDASVGYLTHDAGTISLYLQESLTFIVQTPEAAVSLS